MKKIYLFPDTNLFIQCKPLSDLDWSNWNDFDEVCLLVSRPVQSEIDKQKSGGNSRLTKRARVTATIFRNILLSENGYLEVRDANPTVRIYLHSDFKFDEDLSDRLNYAERDDQLVGVVSLYVKRNPSHKVKLLTHDTGPMATAKMIGVEFTVIQDEWLLPPETDETEKRINLLQNEIIKYKKSEPSFKVRFVNSATDDSKLSIDIVRYTELSQEDVAYFIARIESAFPMARDFEYVNTVAENRSKLVSFNETKVFVPASSEEIYSYQNEEYPNWLHKCGDFLSKIHQYINSEFKYPEIVVFSSNDGSRPALDARVTLSAKGKIKILPPKYLSEDSEAEKSVPIGLPPPPIPPRGRWTTKKIHMGIRDGRYATLTQIHDGFDLGRLMAPIKNRNANEFYYESRPDHPVTEFSLTCEQWRHQNGDEDFEFMVVPDSFSESISGAIEVKVQAANLSDPVVESKPIFIKCKEVSSLERAKSIVDDLLGKRSNWS